jgi:16S rRNA (guanine966-N2)-methyltransferase
MASVLVGKYKGRKFFSGKDPKLRPTQGRVKKSAMQILEPFEDLTILDLYGGLGTLGIEALSRGAKSVTFVEKYYTSLKYLKKNIEHICPNENTKIVQEDVISFLKTCNQTFDVILVDPPYTHVEIPKLHALVKSTLAEDGKYFIEMKQADIDKKNIRIVSYGNTQVIFGWNKNK